MFDYYSSLSVACRKAYEAYQAAPENSPEAERHKKEWQYCQRCIWGLEKNGI